VLRYQAPRLGLASAHKVRGDLPWGFGGHCTFSFLVFRSLVPITGTISA
jgi:hypothetical protein